MRYLVGFLFVLAGLAALPVSATAQDGEESASSEPSLQEPATEEPALQLELTPEGVNVTPTPPRTADGYTLDEMELRVKRAKIGYGVSTVAAGAGLTMGIAAGIGAYGESFDFFSSTPPPGWIARVGWTGVALVSVGVVGMITSGILMKRRKRERDGLRYRVQWDLAQSRLVF